MALSKEQAQSLRDQLRLITPGRVGRYLYCAAGADGDPVLLIHRRVIPRSETRSLRRAARRKIFSRGTIECSDDRNHFVFRTDEPVDRMERHLRTFFGTAIPKLRRSRILSKAPVEEAADTLTEAQLRQRLEALYLSVRESERQIHTQEDVVAGCEAQVAELQGTLFARHQTRADADAALSSSQEALGALKQKQERLHADIVAAEAKLQRVMLRDAEGAGALSTDGAPLDALEDAAEAAERAAGTAEESVADLERRQAELSGRLRSKDLARRRLESEGASDDRLTQIDEEAQKLSEQQDSLEAELEAARQAARESIRDHQIARSRAATALERWSAEQQQWWAELEPDAEVLAALRTAEQRLLRAVGEEDRRAATAAALEEELRAFDAATAAAEAALVSMASQHDALAALSEQLLVALESAGPVVDTTGLEARLAEVESRLEALAAEQQVAAEQLASDERAAIAEQLRDARSDLSRASGRADERRQERNALLLHDSEQQRSDDLREDAAHAEDAVAAARTRLEVARAEEALGSTELMDLQAARQAVAEAHAALSIAELETEQLGRIAGKIRGLRGEAGRGQIDEARGKLPEAELARSAARQAYEDALARLESADRAHDDAPGEQHAQVERARARAEEEEALAEAEQAAAQAQLRVAEDDARVAGLAAEVQGRQVATLLEQFTATLSPARRKGLQAARVREQAASEAAGEATNALFDAEMRLEQLQDRLSELTDDARGDEADNPQLMRDIRETLQQLGELSRHVQRCRDAAAAALDAAEATSQKVEDQHAALIETAARGADPLGVALRDARAAHGAALRDAADAARRDAAAQDRLSGASVAAVDARRARQVARVSHDAQALIADSYDLIDAIHQLKDPATGATRAYDLEDPGDRDAAREALSPELVERVEDFRSALAQRAAEMIRDGATPEELQAVFRAVPNGLRPAAYRSEVAAFARMEAAFSEEHEEARDAALVEAVRSRKDPAAVAAAVQASLDALGLSPEDLRAHILKPILDEDPDRLEQARLGSDVLASANDLAGVFSVLPDAITGPLESVLTIVGAAAGGAAAIRDGKAGTEDTEEDPVSKKMRQDVLLDSLSELTAAGAQVGKLLLPALGTAEAARQLVIDALEAAARKMKARYDGLLSEAARTAGSPLAGPFAESLAREEALCAKYRVQISADATEIAAAILGSMPGPGAALKVALELSAAAGRFAAERKVAAEELRQARLARRLLADARRGDDAARAELFKHHPRYAKGLIAHMAYNDGDPFALMYTRERGLAEADIAASSEAIIRRYLLEGAEQSLDLPEAAEQHSKLRKIVDALSRPEKLEIIDPDRLAELREGARVAGDLIDTRARAERMLEPEADTDPETRAALEALLAEGELTLETLRLLASEAMAEVADQTEKIQDDDAPRRRALAEVREATLAVVALLAQAL